MKRPKIVTNFHRYRDSELSSKFQYILTCMTGNEQFTNPVPTIADIKQAADNFTNALAEASTRSKQAIASKNLMRQYAIQKFTALASYIQVESLGMELVMLSSGFSIAKNVSPIGVLPKPTKFNVQSQEQGSVKVKLNTIYGADSYQYEYKQVAAENWNIIVNTKSSILITGLISGMAYQFRVAPIGASTVRIYSDTITSYIL